MPARAAQTPPLIVANARRSRGYDCALRLDWDRRADLLGRARTVLLTTVRKNGTPVATPVWVVRDGDELRIWTNPTSGKVKRIRRNASVTLVPCSTRGEPRGEAVPGTARAGGGSAAGGSRPGGGAGGQVSNHGGPLTPELLRLGRSALRLTGAALV